MMLDTTALIDILRGNPDIGTTLIELEKKNVALTLTSVSVFELWQGIADLNNREKSDKIHFLLESLGIFLLDVPSAQEAGSIHATLKKEGRIIDPEDSMIAGIAKVHHETILTRNVKHFERIPELQVKTY